MSPATWLASSGRFLEKCVDWLAIVLLVSGGALVTFDVVTRYIFRFVTDWISEMGVFTFVYAALLYGGITFKEGGHVRVDFLLNKLKGKPRVFAELMLDLITLAFIVLLTWSGVNLLEQQLFLGTRTASSAAFPIWAFISCAAVGGSIMGIYIVLSMIKSIGNLLHSQSTPVKSA